MRMLKYASVTLAMVFLAAFCAAAQGTPGNLLTAEFQTPKPGMTQQYEQGRKQKADWHKQQKDPSALLVFETISGERTGTYVVVRGGLHWADLDHPSVPEAADTEEYNKAIGPYVASIQDSYYELLPKFGRDNSPLPPQFQELLTIRVKPGRTADFTSAVARISAAERKANSPTVVEIYELVNGGFSGTYVVSLARPHWADFGANPNEKPMEQVLADEYGPDGAASTMAALNNSIESEYSEIIKFRQDLSYIPAK
ncbi:MAG TPA: hypothetical protein VI216_13220 [Candidatus Acidoferrales bacterium]